MRNSSPCRPSKPRLLPPGLGMVEAAAVPLAALTALQALTDVADGVAGKRVAVHGASGGVGHFAVQIANALGAEVTAVASAANADFCLGLGADHFRDYESQPLAEGRGSYDVLFDVFGSLSMQRCAPLLTPDGIVISTVPSEANIRDVAATKEARQRMRLVVVRSNADDLGLLATMAGRGQVTPFVERCYAFADVVGAHEHVERKHTRGKVVVSVLPVRAL